MLLPGFVFDPPSARWILFKNQDRKSAGSDCAVSVNFFDDFIEMSCNNSCGETCDLKARGFHILRTNIDNLLMSSGFVEKSSNKK